MKNILNILSTLFGAVIVFASCHREDIPCNTPEESVYPITFSAVTAYLDTKSPETKDETIARIKADGFHVWGSRDNDSNVFTCDGIDVTYVAGTDGTSGLWQYSPVRYWASGDYTFYAVSPKNFVSTGGFETDGSFKLNFGDGWDLSSTKIDLMLGKATASGASKLAEANGPTPVTLTFEHMLSMINFTAKNTEGRESTITITGVEISGNHYVAESCTMSSSSRQWNFADATAIWPVGLQNDVTLATDQFSAITSDLVVFPENNFNLTVKVSYNITIDGATGSDIKSATITPTWESGKIYTYQINLTSDHITFSDPKVKDWADGGSADDEIEF